ncbi:phosphopantetheine-binding protein [Streptomyces sp. NPDC001667]
MGPRTSMILLGLDSLGAVQLQQRLQQGLGITIAPGVIWVRPTPADLADWFLGRMGLGTDKPPP